MPGPAGSVTLDSPVEATIKGKTMRRERWTLLALCGATFMLLLDITIVQAALPSIQRDLGGNLSGLQWTVDAYTLPLAAFIVTLGTVADRYGRRSVFLGGVVLFTAASLACALSTTIVALDIARAVQGVGGAAMFATTLALVGQEFAGAARGRAILVWGSTVGAAVACGPVLGGLLTEYATWKWIFLVNVPIGVVTVALTLRFVADGRDTSGRPLDLYGLATLTAGLTLVVSGLLRGSATDWSSTPAAVSLAAGAACLVGFAALQRRALAMLDRGLLRNHSFVATSAATLALGAGMFATFLYLTVYLQGALGLSPVAAGLRLLCATLPVFVTPFVLRRLRLSPVSGRLIAVGLAVTGAGLLTMTWATASTTWVRLLPGLLLAGIGIGIANAAIAATALAVVPAHRAGLAAGVSNSCRVTGIAVGVAVLGAVFRTGINATLPAHSNGAASLVGAGYLRAAAARLGERGIVSAQAAFTSGFHLLLTAAALIALTGSAVAYRFARHLTHPSQSTLNPAQATGAVPVR